MSLLLALQTPPTGWLTTPETANAVPAFKFRRPDAGGTFGGATLPALLWPDFPIPTVKLRSQLGPPLQVTGFGVGAVAATPTFPQPGLEAVPLKSRLFRNVGTEVAESWPTLQFQVTGWRQPEEIVPLRSKVFPRSPESFGGPGIIPYPLWVPTIGDVIALRSRLTRPIADAGPESFPPVIVVVPLSAWPPADTVALRKRLLTPLQVTGFGVGQITPPPLWLPTTDDILPIRSRLFRPLKGGHEEPEAWTQAIFPIPGWLQPQDAARMLRALFKSGQTVFSGGGAFFQIPAWWPMDVVTLHKTLMTPLHVTGFGVGQTVAIVAPPAGWAPQDLMRLRRALMIPMGRSTPGDAEDQPLVVFQIPSWMEPNEPVVLRSKLYRPARDVEPEVYPILAVGPFPSDEFLLLKIGGKLYLTLAGTIKMQTP